MGQEQLFAVQAKELNAVMGPYVGVALVLLILWITIAVRKMPKAAEEDNRVNLGPALKRLLRNRHYVLGVIAQFFYVGAQLCVWSFHHPVYHVRTWSQ
jgi:MFS transporter, FHS family, L-fucose permease